MLRRAVIAAILLGSLAVPMAHPAARAWPGGTIRYWAEPQIRATAALAAARWNDTGIGIRFRPAHAAAAADVVIRAGDRRLKRLCGKDCLGWSTEIGPPASGPATVWLGRVGREPVTPVAVWVATHELGHVLGLRHASGRGCSVMKPRAFVGSCQPSLESDGSLRCIPARADVRAAARMYGRRPGSRPSPC